jgi:hypothetical protein
LRAKIFQLDYHSFEALLELYFALVKRLVHRKIAIRSDPLEKTLPKVLPNQLVALLVAHIPRPVLMGLQLVLRELEAHMG